MRPAVGAGGEPPRPPPRRPTIPLNPERKGHVYPSYTYEVSREKLREYAVATGVADPALHADPGTVPLGDLLAPPTFAACFTVGRLGDLVADPELGAHWNLLHVSQAYHFRRPVRGGDVLRCTPHIAELVDRGRMELLTFVVDVADAATDASVLTSESGVLFLAPTGEGG